MWNWESGISGSGSSGSSSSSSSGSSEDNDEEEEEGSKVIHMYLFIGYAVVGGIILFSTAFGKLIKYNWFLSEPLIALLIGFGLSYMMKGILVTILSHAILLELLRLLLTIQLMVVAINLPTYFVFHSGRNALLALLLFVMTFSWVCGSLFVYWIFEQPLWHCFLIGACFSCTCPLFLSSMLTGPVAHHVIPEETRNLLLAESGFTTGMTFLFVFLCADLIDYPTSIALGQWLYWTWLYQTCIAVICGLSFAFLMISLLKVGEYFHLQDKRNISASILATALIVGGIGEIIQINSYLSVFVTGLVFGMYSFTEEKIHHPSLAIVHDTTDMVLSVIAHLCIGLLLPTKTWTLIGLDKLFLLSTGLIMLRRFPLVLILFKIFRSCLPNFPQVLLVGWFGSLGTPSLYYSLYIALRIRFALAYEIVSFVILCNAVVHGITIPLLVRWNLFLQHEPFPPGNPKLSTITATRSSSMESEGAITSNSRERLLINNTETATDSNDGDAQLEDEEETSFFRNIL